MKAYIVVNNLEDWPKRLPGVEVITAKSYITDSSYNNERYARVFNLCRSHRYQTAGYYVSLLAEARGHKPMPSVQTIQDLKNPSMTHFVSDDLEELIQHSFKSIKSDRFVLSIYFGKNIAQYHEKLCGHLFKQYQVPFLQAVFAKTKNKWVLQNITPLAPHEIPEAHRAFVLHMVQEYLSGKRVSVKNKQELRYDLAILYKPDTEQSPSNDKAIAKFVKAAESVGFQTEIITKDDYGRLAEFDALFIRETTSVNHHTYRFARRAHAEGLVVIDDPDSILKCTNKVYMGELLERHKIPTPKTLIVHKDNLDQIGNTLGFPCVLKQPDSAFSNGVTKIATEEELFKNVPQLLEKSDLLIAQEFVPTPFDWRVCVFEGQPLFACKYYMARRHWQIFERLHTGKVLTGKASILPIGLAPRKVVSMAVKAANLIGDGLYGVDLKEDKNRIVVIEINDNPSIDAGVEDRVLHDELYFKIMQGMMRRVENRKGIVWKQSH